MQEVRVNFDQGRKNSQIYINERLETCGVQENLSKAKRVTYGHERWAMNMKRIIEQANMKKKIGDHDLKFVMGIVIQNLVVAYTFTLRWILEHFLRLFWDKMYFNHGNSQVQCFKSYYKFHFSLNYLKKYLLMSKSSFERDDFTFQ